MQTAAPPVVALIHDKAKSSYGGELGQTGKSAGTGRLVLLGWQTPSYSSLTPMPAANSD